MRSSTDNRDAGGTRDIRLLRRGVVLKKEVGGRLKQDLDNDLSLTLNINFVVLKVSYTAFQ